MSATASILKADHDVSSVQGAANRGTLFTDSDEGIVANGPRSADAPTLGSTLILFVIQAVLSSVFIFVAAVSGLITASCSGRDCNFPLIEFSGIQEPLNEKQVVRGLPPTSAWDK